MSTSTFLPDNLLLDASLILSTGTANAQYPLNNIKSNFSTKVFRSNESSVSIVIDLLSTRQIDFIALRGNFIDGLGFNTATIEGSATLVFPGSPTSLDLSQKHSFAFVDLGNYQSFRYWKLTLTGSVYVEVANLFIGKKVQMSDNNIALGMSYVQNTMQSVQTNQYGQRFIDTYNVAKILQGEINYCNETEFNQLNDIQISNGERTPIWFTLDSQDSMMTDSKYMFAGMFYLTDLNWKQAAPGLWNTPITLTECM